MSRSNKPTDRRMIAYHQANERQVAGLRLKGNARYSSQSRGRTEPWAVIPWQLCAGLATTWVRCRFRRHVAAFVDEWRTGTKAIRAR
jgi:hypothetical protein